MTVPEWLDAAEGATSERPPVRGSHAGAALPPPLGHEPSPIALVRLATTLRRRCEAFFDPLILAHLDAALAHQLAQGATARATTADDLLAAALHEGRATEDLARLAQHAASSRAGASKAGAQAALATDVIASFGGRATPEGFDPGVVARVEAAGLVELIATLERTKNALSAAQAQAQALFVAQQRLSQAQAGIAKDKLGAGIAHQVALARSESPHRGRQLCSLSEVLVREMPRTLHACSAGLVSEYRASLLVRETACLSLADRLRVDELICGNPAEAATLGNRALATAARQAAYRLDPEAFVRRQEKAVGERYVSLRPAADGMTLLSALLPLRQGVRILATLTNVATRAHAAGDPRGKGQLMADALMHRLIQHAPCDDGAGGPGDHRGPRPPEDAAALAVAGPGAACTTVTEANISLELVMTDRALFRGASEPALLLGYEPVPAPVARSLILGDGAGSPAHPPAEVWVKRLFTHPASNALVSMDSRARLFPEGMKEFLRLQDQRCRTPFCDAPIREYDHIVAFAAGGETAVANGQGLCTACNQAKEAVGWDARPVARERGTPQRTETITPTGHRYVSTAPPLPGRSRWRC